MDWSVHPYLYQVCHPWHWLTYGQNATAVAAVVSVIAFFGLLLYTVYTKRMWWISQQTRDDALKPYLVLESIQDIDAFRSRVILTNLGANAVNTSIWQQHVTDSFQFKPMFWENKSNNPVEFVGTFRSNQTKEFAYLHGSSPAHIMVIDFKDVAKKRHQFAIYRKHDFATNRLEYDGRMLHPDDYLPFGQALPIRIGNWWRTRKWNKPN